MSSAFSLIVPEHDQSLDTGERFFEHHVENSSHDDSLEDLSEYDHFRERLERDGRFKIYKKPTSTVANASEPPLAEILLTYENGDRIVRDPEGLDQFVESLEAARENLRRELDDERMEAVDRTIEMCINLVEFAKMNGYGVSF